MRRGITVIVVLALLWCGCWAAISYGATRGVHGWLEAMRAQGWQASAVTTRGGFPIRLRTTVDDLHLFAPETQQTVAAPGGVISAPGIWPGYLTLTLADGPINVSIPEGSYAVYAKDAQANLRLQPGLALTLESLLVASDSLHLVSGPAEVLHSEDLSGSFVQSDTTPAQYSFDLAANALTPAPLSRVLMQIPENWPDTFDQAKAAGIVTFTAPPGLRRPAELRALELNAAHLAWGDVALSAQGQMTVDATGQPTGAFQITARNWRVMLDMLQRLGALQPGARLQWEVTLGALSNIGGDLDNLDVTLAYENGRMKLGPIDLGPAPQFGAARHLQ